MAWWFLNNLVATSKLSIVKNDSSERPYVQASLLCNRTRTEREQRKEKIHCAPSDLSAPAPIHSCAWLLGAGCRAYKETELELNLSLGLGLYMITGWELFPILLKTEHSFLSIN